MGLEEQYTTIRHASLDRLWELVSSLHAFINEEFDQTPRIIEVLDMIQDIMEELEFIDHGAEEDWYDSEEKKEAINT